MKHVTLEKLLQQSHDGRLFMVVRAEVGFRTTSSIRYEVRRPWACEYWSKSYRRAVQYFDRYCC